MTEMKVPSETHEDERAAENVMLQNDGGAPSFAGSIPTIEDVVRFTASGQEH